MSFNGSLWFRRQLQNGRLLALLEECQKDDLPVREFQGVVMDRWPILVDLAKYRRAVPDNALNPGKGTLFCNLLRKRQLGPWQ